MTEKPTLAEQQTTAQDATEETPLSSAAVETFLLDHPDFFQSHADLLNSMALPSRFGKGVVDLNQFQSRRLADESSALRQQISDMMAAGEANHQILGRVHQSALAVLNARNFQHFVRIITAELSEILQVEMVTIGVEGGEDWQAGRVNDIGVFVMAPGMTETLMPDGRPICLLSERPKTRDIFGAKAALIQSQALVRLQATTRAPAGVLALGSQDPEKFAPGQATDLLQFLGAVIESQLRAWLELPR